MSDKTGIEWTRGDDGTPGATWNPVTGCTEVSPGCDHCYAKTFAERWRGVPGHHFEQGFDVVLRPERLDQPIRWKKPRRIFVNSMSDLFHDAIPDEYIARVFAVMAQAPQHTFQLLTKRHGRMRSLLNSRDFIAAVDLALGGDGSSEPWDLEWPLRNVWLGVSVENQTWADIRIPALVATPAEVRFLSMEPLLGDVDLSDWLPEPACPKCGHAETDHSNVHRTYGCQAGDGSFDNPICGCRKMRGEQTHEMGDPYANHGLHWVIAGGESGRGARPMDLDWVRSLRDQCTDAGVSFFYKQQGSGDGGPKSRRELDGRTWDEFPAVSA